MHDQQKELEEQSNDATASVSAYSDDEKGTYMSWGGELRATVALAWPLVLTQLAQFSLQTTDVIMMGWLGRDYLAAGSLASALLHPLLLLGIGSLTAVAPMVAQAIGARDYTSVRRTARQGIWVSALLAIIVMTILYQAETIFISLGQIEQTSAMAQSYLNFAALGLFPAMGFIALRGLVTAHSETKVVLIVTIGSFFVNALGNYTLMFGNFGFPRLELAGAGISTSVVNTFVFVALLIFVGRGKTYRAYQVFARFWKPDWPRFLEMLRIGVPIGLMIMVEVGLFSAATVLMGWLGNDELAAHTVALQCAAIAFMVPLGLSQATTIRTGLAYGRKSLEGIRVAGWVSIVMGTSFMALTCLLFLTIPNSLIRLFLDPANPQNATPHLLAVSYLAYAGLFQLFDGLQAMTAGTLRGLGDTSGPMIIAILGYWACGLPTSYYFGFILDWQGEGIWLGLAMGLAVTGVALLIRFNSRERFGLLKFKH
ncbi:MATE family efflux transporter [Cohaesibacter celericrescens]|nr:MATE family efflux transporter [Cohaesibacter celericrescens]